MPQKKTDRRQDRTESGYKIPVRKRSAVLRDFEVAAGPLRGSNRDDDKKSKG